MAHQWQWSQREEISLRWCHRSATSGTAYPQVVVGNSLPSQDVVSHGMGRIQWPHVRPNLPLISIGRVCNLYARSSMSHASETRSPISSGQHRLQHNDQAMIRWMCGVITVMDQFSSQDHMERMQLDDLAKALHICWLRWHGYVGCSDGWPMKVLKLNPVGGRGRGRPKTTWIEIMGMNCLTWTHPSNRKDWSGRLRSAVRLDPPLY